MEGMRCVRRPRQPDTPLTLQALLFFFFGFGCQPLPRDPRPKTAGHARIIMQWDAGASTWMKDSARRPGDPRSCVSPSPSSQPIEKPPAATRGPGTVTWSSELNEYYSCAVQGPAARTPACDYQPASQSPPLLRSTPWSRFRFRRQQEQSCRDVRGAKIKKACLTMVSGNQPRFRSNSKQQGGCGLCGSAKPTCPVPLHCLVRSARQSSRHTTSHWLSRVTAHYQYSALGRGEPTRPGHEG